MVVSAGPGPKYGAGTSNAVRKPQITDAHLLILCFFALIFLFISELLGDPHLEIVRTATDYQRTTNEFISCGRNVGSAPESSRTPSAPSCSRVSTILKNTPLIERLSFPLAYLNSPGSSLHVLFRLARLGALAVATATAVELLLRFFQRVGFPIESWDEIARHAEDEGKIDDGSTVRSLDGAVTGGDRHAKHSNWKWNSKVLATVIVSGASGAVVLVPEIVNQTIDATSAASRAAASSFSAPQVTVNSDPLTRADLVDATKNGARAALNESDELALLNKTVKRIEGDVLTRVDMNNFNEQSERTTKRLDDTIFRLGALDRETKEARDLASSAAAAADTARDESNATNRSLLKLTNNLETFPQDAGQSIVDAVTKKVESTGQDLKKRDDALLAYALQRENTFLSRHIGGHARRKQILCTALADEGQKKDPEPVEYARECQPSPPLSTDGMAP